ncbi:Ig-like domain-containing protein [Pseudomonas sp. SDO524_S393]
MNANSVNVAVVDGKTITQTVDLGAAKTGLPVRIKAVQGGKYIIGEGEKGFAPENLTIKRVGKNLHIALEGTDPDQAQLIIENFEGSGGQLVGLAEDGSYYEYISSDADQDSSAAYLYDGAESAQVLGSQPLTGFGNGLVAGAGIGWFWPALLGLGALGLLGGVYAAVHNKDKDNNADAPVGGGNGDKGSLEGVTDDVGDKQGLIGNGESTDDKTPTFTGIGKPGTSVEIVDNGEVIGTAPVGEDGKWTFTPEEPGLSDGSHNIVIVPVDADGNKGEGSPGHVIIVDTVAPAAPLIEGVYDDTAPNEGLLAAGDSTNDTTPTLSGTAEAGAIVHIYDNDVEIGTAIADADGKWEFTPETELAEGDHAFTIAAEDAAGNISVPSAPFPIVIDITAPEKPGPDNGGISDIIDNEGPVQGSIGDGDSTDDKTPTFTGGGATPGDTVVIIDNGTPIGSVVVGDDGKWEFTPDPALDEGPHEVVVVIKDPAGNESEPSDPITVIIVEDTTPPAKPTPGAGGIEIITDDVGPVTGIIGDGDSTDDTAPTFGGSGAEPGDIVTIIDNGTPIGSVVVGDDGKWEYTPGAGEELAEGNHEIVVVIKDPSGNESEPSDPITIIVDTQAPVAPTLGSVIDDQGAVTGELTSGDITDDARPDLSGTAEAGSLVTIYDNGTAIGSVMAGEDGSWSFTPELPLSNGNHTLTVTATDAAGNVSAPTPAFELEVIAGGAPAAPAIISVVDDQGDNQGPLPMGSTTDDTTPTINGTGEDGNIIYVYDGDTLLGSTTVVGGQWSFTPSTPLEEGDHSLTAQAENAAGNLSPATGVYPITVDTTAPTAPTGQVLRDDVGNETGLIESGDITDDANPTFEGMAEPGSIVNIYDNNVLIGSTTASTNGAWTFTPTTALANGPHSLTAQAVDAAGNVGAMGPAMDFIVDTTAVVISITSVEDNVGTVTGNLTSGQATDDTTPTLNGQATPGATVTIYDGATPLGTVIASATGQWSFTTPVLGEGAHNLTATATTPAGGESDPTPVFETIIDTTAPTAPAIGGASDDVGSIQGPIGNGDTTDDTTPTLSGSGLNPGDTVEILDGDALIGTTKVNPDGTWSYTPTTPLNDGKHDLTVIARDPAGNASAPSAPWTVIVDTTGPVTVISSLSDDVGVGTPSLPETILNGGETDDRSPVINGTSEPGALVTIYANGVELGSVVADATTGAWTFEPAEPLELGAYTLTATSTDAAGNTGPESELFEFDLVGVFHRPVIFDNFGPFDNIIAKGDVIDLGGGCNYSYG